MFAANNRIAARNDEYLAQTPDGSLTKERAMAFLIGVLAIFLAFGVAWLDERFETACARSSISHFYYEPLAGTFFVMVLTFVGAFMIAYRGENRIDGWLATIGGIGGLILAFFPTAGIGCAVGQEVDLRPAVLAIVPEDFGARPLPDRFEIPAQVVRIGDAYTQTWHFAGAGVMFAVLLVFALFIFTRIDPESDRTVAGRLRPTKVARNAVYVASSAVMALGIAMIVRDDSALAEAISGAMADWFAGLPGGNPDYAGIVRPVYHGELLALVAFGVSWLVKGRFGTSVVGLIRGL